MLQHLDTLIAFAAAMLLLSLLVTVLVQAAMAIGRSRTRNLRWGIQQYVASMFPALAGEAESLARQVTEHASLKAGWMSGPSAVRLEELMRILRELGKAPAAPADPPADLAPVDAAIPEPLARLQRELQALLPAAQQPAGQALVQAAQERLQEAVAAARRTHDRARFWFDAAMDRAIERFARTSKHVSFAIAAVLTLVLQVDAFRLFQRLSTDSAARAALVQAADATLQRAEEVFTREDAGRELPRQALLAVAEAQSSPLKQQITPPPEVPFATSADGARWLRQRVAEGAERDRLLAEYRAAVEQRTVQLLGRLGEDAAGIRDELRQASFSLLPERPWGKDLGDPWHWLGMLASALLLGLGAPFWYNALRQLANLRPVMAQKLDPKKQQATDPAA